MDPAFVGPAMAREVTEVYFSRNKFCFTGPSELKETLLCDPFSTGSKAYQYIRNLQVTIRVEDGAHEELEHCYDCFRPLLLVDRKDRLNVSIQILSEFTRPPTYDDEQDMVNVLEALRYPVYELLHAGSTVDIQQYDGDESDQENLGDRKLCSPDQPAANFFQLTAEEWENVSATTARRGHTDPICRRRTNTKTGLRLGTFGSRTVILGFVLISSNDGAKSVHSTILFTMITHSCMNTVTSTTEVRMSTTREMMRGVTATMMMLRNSRKTKKVTKKVAKKVTRNEEAWTIHNLPPHSGELHYQILFAPFRIDFNQLP